MNTPEDGRASTELAETSRFLDFMAEGEAVTFQTFSESPAAKQRRAKHHKRQTEAGQPHTDPLARILHGTLEDNAAELLRLHERGAGVWWMVNYGDGKGRGGANVTGIRALTADTDGAPLGPILATGVEPHCVIETSPGKWHVYWNVAGSTFEQFEAAQTAIAAKFGTDSTLKDISKVLRVPGFLHRKGEPFMVRTVSMEPLQPYPFDDLVRRLGIDLKAVNVRPGAAQRADAKAERDPVYRRLIERDMVLGKHSTPGYFNVQCPCASEHSSVTAASSTVYMLPLYGGEKWGKFHCLHDHCASRSQPQFLQALGLEPQDVWREQAGMADVSALLKAAAPQIITTAAHLMDAEFPPLRWCVPDILPEGTYLLSAKPKVGKSWLALQMGHAIASAGTVLGKKVEGGSVLVLALEDNKRRLKSRLERLGAFMFAKRADLDRLHVETEWPRVHEGGAAAIEQWLQANPDARLVVIDTLAKFRPSTGGRASAYEQDYQALAPVKALSDKYRVTVLVVTHNRKMESDDALDLISGTMGLSGGCDGALVIERERGSATAKLHLIGRDIENDGCFAIEFHKSNCNWSMVGDASVITKSREREQLMQVFKDERRPLSRKEVIELSGRKAGTVGRLLAAMVNDGNLVRTDDGHYTPPGYYPEQGEQRERGEQGEQGEQEHECSPDSVASSHVRPCSPVRPVRPT